MCLAPVTITNNRELWTPDGNTGGVTTVVPCGKCVVCLQRRAVGWMFRLSTEWRNSSSAYFITLTYENECVPITTNGLQSLDKSHLQKFFKKLRHKTPKKIKYYACGEYGSRTYRPHYHFIGFNLPTDWQRCYSIVSASWPDGLVHVGRCSYGSIAYTTGYVIKGGKEDFTDFTTGEIDDRQPEFSLMSKGLGASYLTPAQIDFHKRNLIGFLTNDGGKFQPMPRYYKDKIFDKEEKFKITQDAREYRELNIEQMFNDAIHEVQWKKDQQRKQEKQKMLKRVRL